MIDLVFSLLDADATLAGFLAGGIYNGQTAAEISRQATPGAFDAYGEIQPCGILKPETETPAPGMDGASRVYFAVWLYQRDGAGAIESAKDRIFQLLDGAKLSGAGSVYRVIHAGDLLGQEDPGLGVPMVVTRYMATRQRRAPA